MEKDTKSIVMKILSEINSEILDYNGDNLYRDGLLDSFNVIEIVSELEEAFDIEINAEDVIAENFANKESIVKLVEKITGV
mgnify:CR=1 FL=1